MHNLKSRIKRRKQGVTGSEIPTRAGTSVAVGADWEFVNFNPVVFGPKRTASSESCGNVSLIRATQSNHEDYYEFPTSTKLPLKAENACGKVAHSAGGEENQGFVDGGAGAPPLLRRRKESPCERLINDPRFRHSLHSTFDLFHPPQPHGPAAVYENIKPSDETVDGKASTFYVPPPPPPRLNAGSNRPASMTILDTPVTGLDSCPPLIPLRVTVTRAPSSAGKTTCTRSDSGIGTMSHDRSAAVVQPIQRLESGREIKVAKVKKKTSSVSRQGQSGKPVVTSRLPLPVTNVTPRAVSPRTTKPSSSTAILLGARGNGVLGFRKMVSTQIMWDKPLASSGNSSNNLKGGDKRPDTLSEERLTQDGSTYEDDGHDQRPNLEPRRASNIVGRSESCKERPQRKQPRERERRKHSDPNLTSKSSDVDLDSHRILSDTNNSSASNSSLSARSSDSPSTSLELVAPHHSSSSLPGRHSETPETGGHSGDYRPVQQSWEGDSDIEVEQDPPDWTKDVPEEILSQLESTEKKRQEVLNELLHTERSHVRNLKVVDRLFHRPIRSMQLLPADLIQMLFSSWEEMLEVHGKFNTALKRKRLENPVIGDIGPLLLEIFEGDTAEKLKRAAAACCARQQIGLKALKERREKSPKLNAFLAEAESDPVCRRLQIQDMIPMVMQRLTKYPLILSKLAHYHSVDTQAHLAILRALDMSKEILNSVNASKKEAEDNQRLLEIQSRLDKSSLEKGILSLEKGVDKPDINFINELRNLDITAHRLVHEGGLQWKSKSSKQKGEVLQEVELVLLEDMVVLLLKQDDRFVLKIHTSSSFTGKAERVVLRPVIKLNNLIIRANAADKRAFMLINMTSSNMYDLVCSCMEERKQWLHHITKAAEDYKSRQESRRSDFHPSPTIPASLPEPEEHKESNDLGEGSEVESSSAQDSLLLGSSPFKEPSPAPPDTERPPSPDPAVAGTARLSTSTASSPNPNRRVGEFLRVTETSPLIEPSEVVVVSREVQFALPVLSAHEELRRLDVSIKKALGEKMALVGQMLHIPEEGGGKGEEGGPKDSRQLVLTCMQEVDKLQKTIVEQNLRAETLGTAREQASISTTLVSLLSQLLTEVSRKDDELEARRQELHRLREQNHGYQERLSKGSRTKKSSIGGEAARPTTLIPSEQAHDDPGERRSPSKRPSSATCNCSDSSHHNHSGSSHSIDSDSSACDTATEEYADALEGSDSWEERDVEKAESESESEEYLMQASTLTLVPDAEDGLYANEVGPPMRRDSETKASNGHDGAPPVCTNGDTPTPTHEAPPPHL